MGILRNGLNLMDVSAFWQQVLIGSIIVIAVYIDVLRKDLELENKALFYNKINTFEFFFKLLNFSIK